MIPETVKILGRHCALIGRYDLKLPPINYPDSWEIRKAIAELAVQSGISDADAEDGEIRWPGENAQVNDTFFNNRPLDAVWDPDGWHQDGQGRHDGLLFWSNIDPTEIKLADGTIIRPEPSEVIAIVNRAVQHRMPKTIGPNRYFCRMAIYAPEWLLDGLNSAPKVKDDYDIFAALP